MLRNFMRKGFLCPALLWVFCISSPAAPTIGKIADSSHLTGYRSLVEGTTVEARLSGTRVYLDNGGQVWLAPGASGIFYRDHVALEKGGARVDLSDGYELWAGGVSVAP